METYAAIGELEKELVGSFYRCHGGYLVNMAFITGYGNDSIALNNGETIILSKDKYSEFVKVYMRYLKMEVVFLYSVVSIIYGIVTTIFRDIFSKYQSNFSCKGFRIGEIIEKSW